MKNMMFFTVFLIAGCYMATAVRAVDLNGVRAFPVPFSPSGKNHVLTISDKDNVLIFDGCSVKLEIFDINGDHVVTRNYGNGSPVVWNGRNSRGRYVRPGFYILKLTVSGQSIPEGDSEGDPGGPADPYGTKIIKIVVK